MKPAPTSGTITVRKEVSLPPDTRRPEAPLHRQHLLREQRVLPHRGERQARQHLVHPRRRQRRGTSPRRSRRSRTLDRHRLHLAGSAAGSPANVDTGSTSVALAPGDDVVCTYKNTFRRPPSGLTLRKVSTGGTGTLRLRHRGRRRPGRRRVRGDHRPPGSPTLVEPADEIADLPAGTYTVTETTPPDVGGTWSLDRVDCLPDAAKQERSGDKVDDHRRSAARAPSARSTTASRRPATSRCARSRSAARARRASRSGRCSATSRPEREQIATTTEPGVAVTATGDEPRRAPDRRVLDPGDDRRPEPLGDRVRRLRRHPVPVRQGAVRARADRTRIRRATAP